MKCPACAASIPEAAGICPICQIPLSEFSRPMSSETPRGRETRRTGWDTPLVGCLGMITLIAALLGVVAMALPPLLTAISANAPAKRRAECMSNLRQIALALHKYHETYGSFPPAVTFSADGRPMHSWRVLILPFLDSSSQNAQYSAYNLNEPWNSPGNRAATAAMPAVFACPLAPHRPASGQTSHLALDGPRTVMNSRKPARWKDIIDSLSDTLLLIEVKNSQVHWTEPRDIDVSQGGLVAPGALTSLHGQGCLAAFAGGNVQFVSEKTNAEVLQALWTIDGGEQVGDF